MCFCFPSLLLPAAEITLKKLLGCRQLNPSGNAVTLHDESLGKDFPITITTVRRTLGYSVSPWGQLAPRGVG